MGDGKKNIGKKYQIILASSALKQLNSFPKNYREKIIQKIDSLSEEPRPFGVEKLKNRGNDYRVRVGIYRIIYSIYDKELLIDVIDIDHRKQIYK